MDLNDAPLYRWSLAETGSRNAPVHDLVLVYPEQASSSMIIQKAMAWSTNQAFIRRYVQGSWSVWKEL